MEGPDSVVCKSIVPPDAEVSVTKREVTSYKSMFGNVDRVREIVAPGAFASWADLQGAVSKGQIPTRHNHRELVGKMIHAEEDSVGLLTTDKYGTDPVSDRVFSLVRENILTTSSFQASFKASDRIKQNGPDGEPVWVLKSLRLKEAGPADPDFAVNPETRVVSVKGLAEVASVLGNLSGLNGQEAWTLDSLKMLSPEDKDALLIVLRQLPHGMACEAIIAEMEGEAAEDPDYEPASEKAMQLSEAIDNWKTGQLWKRLEQINRRLSAAN